MRPDKLMQWLNVAETMNNNFSSKSKEAQLKKRGCKERLFLMTKKYKEDNKRALKRCEYVHVHMVGHKCVFSIIT